MLVKNCMKHASILPDHSQDASFPLQDLSLMANFSHPISDVSMVAVDQYRCIPTLARITLVSLCKVSQPERTTRILISCECSMYEAKISNHKSDNCLACKKIKLQSDRHHSEYNPVPHPPLPVLRPPGSTNCASIWHKRARQCCL